MVLTWRSARSRIQGHCRHHPDEGFRLAEEQLGAQYDEIEIPADLKEKCESCTPSSSIWRSKKTKRLWKRIRRQAAQRRRSRPLHPQGRHQVQVRAGLCGSASRQGVQPLLDAVVDFLPSPLDIRR